MENHCSDAIKESLSKAIPYDSYRLLVSKLARQNRTTGKEQSATRIKYAQLNDQRMKRWDKTFKISGPIKMQIEKPDRETVWLVITECWCGDAAPSLPLMDKIAEINPCIDLRIVLRDENLELMECHLTDGAQPIPKLLVVDRHSGELVYTWDPRFPKQQRW